MYDIIIVGAGPAGLTAALYARRANKKVLIIEKSTVGGQITYSPKIENYPGFIQMSGNELADKLFDQITTLGVEFEIDEVVDAYVVDGIIKVVGESATYEGKSLIIAVGAKHRKLGVEGEDDYIGEGVSYCAICDGAFYAGKDVGIVGGGNSALQEAVLLSETSKKVTIIQNLAYFTGEARLVEAVSARSNIEVIYSSVVKSFVDDNGFGGVVIENTEDKKEKTLKLDALFVAIGLVPDNKAFGKLIKINNYGYADSPEDCTTTTAGVFVAGDCRVKTTRQITTAMADGTVAAISACRYIDSL